MKFGKIGSFINDNKKTLILIGSAVVNIVAIVEAVRAGVKIKEKFDNLPEDATFKDKAASVVTTPAFWVSVGCGIASNAGYLVVHHLDVRDIIATGSAASLLLKKNKAKDEAVEETVDERTATEIDRLAGDKLRTEIAPLAFNEVIDHHSENPTYLENKITNTIHLTNTDVIRTKWAEFQRDMRSIHSKNKRNDGYVDLNQFFVDYLDEEPSTLACMLGFKSVYLNDIDIEFSMPLHEEGKPVYRIFRFTEEPEQILPFT